MSSDGTEHEILDAVVARLIAKIAGFNANNCFICDDVLPLSAPQSKVICTVSSGDAQYDVDAYFGGAGDQLTEDLRVRVTPLIRSFIDAPARATEAITGTQGILQLYKGPILRALTVGSDADCRPKGIWNPTYEGQELLRDGFPPLHCTAPGFFPVPGQRDQKIGLLGFTLTFLARFDWRWD